MSLPMRQQGLIFLVLFFIGCSDISNTDSVKKIPVKQLDEQQTAKTSRAWILVLT